MAINTDTFKENFRIYYRPLCLFALHYLHDIDNAEDTVQDCFAELWERKDSGMEISDIKSYLYSGKEPLYRYRKERLTDRQQCTAVRS